jgi:hypothetical protein
MVSAAYFEQFDKEMLHAAWGDLSSMTIPDRQYLKDHAWGIFVQLVVTLLTIVTIFFKRTELRDSKQWSFLAERIVALGLVMGLLLPLIAAYGITSSFVLLINSIVVGIAFLRIIDKMMETS